MAWFSVLISVRSFLESSGWFRPRSEERANLCFAEEVLDSDLFERTEWERPMFLERGVRPACMGVGGVVADGYVHGCGCFNQSIRVVFGSVVRFPALRLEDIDV